MQILGRPWHRGEVLLADGAWGTEFHRRGLMQGNPSDEWNLSHPEMVREVTREYLEAGAAVILTNTFGASRIRLEQHGLADRVPAINLAAARIAREVIGSRAVVAGDIRKDSDFIGSGGGLGGDRILLRVRNTDAVNAVNVNVMVEINEIA